MFRIFDDREKNFICQTMGYSPGNEPDDDKSDYNYTFLLFSQPISAQYAAPNYFLVSSHNMQLHTNLMIQKGRAVKPDKKILFDDHCFVAAAMK